MAPKKSRRGKADQGKLAKKLGTRQHKFNGERAEVAKLVQGLLDLEQLFTHTEIQDTADALHISTNTLYKDLGLVQKALGVELRTENNGFMTVHAELLRPLARDVAQLIASVRTLQEGPIVHIAMTSHLSRNYIPAILDDERVKRGIALKHFRLAVLDRRADSIPEAVRTGQADIGIAPISSDAVVELHLHEKKTFQSKLVVLQKKGPNNQPSYSWNDLSQLGLILHERGTATRIAIDRASHESRDGKRLTPILEVSDAMLMLELVAKGHGTGITALGPAIKDFVRDFSLHTGDGPPSDAENLPSPFATALEVRVGVLLRKSHLKSDAVNAVARAALAALDVGFS